MKSKGMTLVVILICLAILVITTGYIFIKTLSDQNAELKQENIELRQDIRKIKKQLDCVQIKYLGQFKATFYTDDVASCGNADGITSTGTHVSDMTVAVDPEVIPMGSLIYIEGIGFRHAEDTGGAIDGKILDVYVDSREEALQLGVKKAGVYLIEEATK